MGETSLRIVSALICGSLWMLGYLIYRFIRNSEPRR